MLTILNIVLPVFAIVGFGYGAVRIGYFPKVGVVGLIAFVNNFAAPSMLFTAMLNVDFGTAFDLRIMGGFFGCSFLAMGIGTLVAVLAFGSSGPRIIVCGFSAGFSNLLMLGVPILQRGFGDEALPVAYSLLALQAPILFTTALIIIEFMGGQEGHSFVETARSTAMRIIKNPLLIAIIVGLLVNISGLTPPALITDITGILGRAMLPAALFGLGGALNDYGIRDNWQQAVGLSLLKLIVHPLITWVALVPLLGVPHEIARYVVLLAAMPAGFNVYLLATRTNQGVNIATNTILITAAGAVVSVSVWLYILSL